MSVSGFVFVFFLFVTFASGFDKKYLSDVNNLVKHLFSEVRKNSTNECVKRLAKLPFSTKLIFDSSGKIPNGIYSMNLKDFGTYDQCLRIKETVNCGTHHGKYCLGSFAFKLGDYINQLGLNTTISNITIPFEVGYCLLDFCTLEDFQEIFPWATFQEDFCYTNTKERPFDFWDLSAIYVYGVFAVIVVLSTLYDLYSYYKRSEPSHVILIAFSLWTNGKKIFTPSYNPDQLTCINGFKAISMTWIVYCHVPVYDMKSTADNLKDMQEFMKDSYNMHLKSATLSVDTFFAIGGLLLVYTALRANDKGVRINVFMMYLHRYLRLTPALVGMWLFQSSLLRYVSNGPIAGQVHKVIEPCRDRWWIVMLYIQNWIQPEHICIQQSWYLSVDMQIFLVAPWVLLILIKWKKIGLMLLMLLSLAGIIIPFAVTYILDLRSSLVLNDDMMIELDYLKYYYMQPFTRFGPYIIGMIFGYILFIQKYKKPHSKMTILKFMKIMAIYCIAIGGILACIYGNTNVINGTTTDIISRSFHNGLNRNAWAVSVCLILTLCALHGGPINAFLSNPIFQFLSNISYAIYLTHVSVIQMRMWNNKYTNHFSVRDVNDIFLGDYINTLIVSFFLTAVFETPIITLEKLIFGNAMKKTKNDLNK